MAKSSLRLVAPASELRTVGLRRHSNRDMGRDREHLTEHEVGNRYGQRDATMIQIGLSCRAWPAAQRSPIQALKPIGTCSEAALSPRGSPREKSDLPSGLALAHSQPISARFPMRRRPSRRKYRAARRRPTGAASGT
jgi:hypothetical protein